jgi:hypothetical protein
MIRLDGEAVRGTEACDADGRTVPDVRHRRGGRSYQFVHASPDPTSLLPAVAGGKAIWSRKAAIVPSDMPGRHRFVRGPRGALSQETCRPVHRGGTGRQAVFT